MWHADRDAVGIGSERREVQVLPGPRRAKRRDPPKVGSLRKREAQHGWVAEEKSLGCEVHSAEQAIERKSCDRCDRRDDNRLIRGEGTRRNRQRERDTVLLRGERSTG